MKVHSLFLRVRDYFGTVSELRAIGNALTQGRITPAQASDAVARMGVRRDVASADAPVASTLVGSEHALPTTQHI
jgi:hypothetical protein